ACTNLAGALLARALSRRREFAVRVSIGAGRGRLIRQLLTESTVVALTGGAVGLLLAVLMLEVVRNLVLPALPPYVELSMDNGVVFVMSFVALCTGLACGAAPALSVACSDLQGTLREETCGSSESRRSRRLRGVLVAGQLALCMSLLAGAGLLARSLGVMTRAPLGFAPKGAATAYVHVQPRVDPRGSRDFYLHFVERLRNLPGVEATASATYIPMEAMSQTSLSIEGAPLLMFMNCVSDDYFRTLRIPLRKGRTFGVQERFGWPTAVVISESMARRY